MPADKAGTGTGRRRQGATDPAVNDDSNRSRERALDREAAMGAVDTVHDAGRQPGAHGRQSPHQNIKPGTRRDIEEAKPRKRDDSR